MNRFRWATLAVLAAVCGWGRPTAAADAFDQHGGWPKIEGKAAESFHLEKIGSRWWLVTPEGHGMFVRAVSKVDTSDYGGSGGFLAYDGIWLETSAGHWSTNLQAAAENSHTRDVVQSAGGVTLRARAMRCTSARRDSSPNFTYFWLDQMGAGGIQWHYSHGQRLETDLHGPAARTRPWPPATTAAGTSTSATTWRRTKTASAMGEPPGQPGHLVGS